MEIENKKPSDGKEVEGEDRQQWRSSSQFLMSCIAMSVGLGNVWRFPFTAYENGGGAFLIPYLIVLVVVGKPFYYMELAVGQFCSRGPVKVWNLAPGLKGIGVAQMISTTSVVTYYGALMAITIHYLVASFSKELPWALCREEWTACFDMNTVPGTNTSGMRSSAEIYYIEEVMHQVPTLEEGAGQPVLTLTLYLVVTWLTVLLVLINGVRSSGPASYVFALLPYFVLVILLIRGVFLPGSGQGILYFITPQWDKLLDAQVWYSAVTQCFFSLSVSFGPLINYASFNPFRHNVHRDSWIVTSMDTLTSMLAGCTVFAILGNLAYERGDTDISSVVQGGSSMAFISYPETIARFQTVPQLFSVLFFLMLYALGIGSTVALSSAAITVWCDQFPSHSRRLITLAYSVMCFLIGIAYVTQGGQYILDLVDYYLGTFIIFIVAIVEIIGFMWIYGVSNFTRDLRFMLDRGTSLYFRACWGVVTPVFLILILLYSLATLNKITYNGGLEYPLQYYVIGWLLFGIGLFQIPFWTVFQYFKLKNMSFSERMKTLFSPNSNWGPTDPDIKRKWKEFCGTQNTSVAEDDTMRAEEQASGADQRTIQAEQGISGAAPDISKSPSPQQIKRRFIDGIKGLKNSMFKTAKN